MADAAFDAVILGGGNKALVLAMYLSKYGGMSTAIFERRHEVGGGWSSEESPAPGFIGNTHSTTHYEMYHEPVQEDFPDFWEKGARYAYYKGSIGMIFREDHASLVCYTKHSDPSQERTASQIAQFSQRDAETWLTWWERFRAVIRPALMEWQFNPPVPWGTPDALDRLLQNPAAGLDPMWVLMSGKQVVQDVFESVELQSTILRAMSSWGFPVDQTGCGLPMFLALWAWPETMCIIGGTHSLAHAASKIVLDSGGKIFNKQEVKKIIIQDGKAVGIMLSDGTEVAARKLVVSTADPRQFCFDLIGKEFFDPKVIRRVERLDAKYGCITWYSWALREAPNYRASAHNPDVNEVQWLGLGKRDADEIAREEGYLNAGLLCPDPQLITWGHTLVDKTQAPEGMHVMGTEATSVLPANKLSEEEWLEFKKSHAEYVMSQMREYTTNIDWDKVIGCDHITPYDTANRLKNMAPEGCMTIITHSATQLGRTRPTPELAGYTVPGIEGLYACGGAWHPYTGGNSYQGYNCYKLIAQRFGLRKPWDEKGRPW
ncbi:MAG: NAD(P)/FAD-dependent oxidoreductase [Clostridia bacterium]|nr:MAG: NAD(P)/FAD-dependent oxidoreductase [Clostridia bacterium]